MTDAPRPDRPMQNPARHFHDLTPMRARLEAMAARYPSRNADYQALEAAVHALDRAAVHFGLERLWFTATSRWGNKMPHDGPIQPPD